MAKDTSWEKVSDWYDKIVGKMGHYYHQHVILPNALKLMPLNVATDSVLDLACGQGILSRHLPKNTRYTGVDLAQALIESAKAQAVPKAQFLHCDITATIPLPENSFSHAFMLLALQNLEKPEKAFDNASRLLKKEGKFLIVLNHPCYRIPRQSSWGVEEERKLQYRRIDRYLSALKIPIQAHPGEEKEAATWSFHYPISYYAKHLKEAGFVIETIEEWCSDKESTGRNAKRENRAREEFPLFMAILAKKVH